MPELIETDICVIGGGSGGLSVAAGAVQMGARTVLIEHGKMGGDCLNYGCVPSKALISAAKTAQSARESAKYGITTGPLNVDMQAVRSHIRTAIRTIEPHDSVERFEGLGVRVLSASGKFVSGDEVETGGARVRARWFVVATGSRPSIPPIPGLDGVRFFTNETIFENDELPSHLVVIGGGPIGCELAQAYRRLGADATIVDVGPILAKEDPELTEVVRNALLRDGVSIVDRTKVVRAGAEPSVTVVGEDGERTIVGSHLLIATGRLPNIEMLDLANAGIEATASGIVVDGRLRTTNKRVFAIGDVVGGMQFTHVASYHAGIVIRNALFRLPSKAKSAAIPWTTFTSPELAHVGLTAAQAETKGLAHHVVSWRFDANDRAIAEAKTDGFAKIVVDNRGHCLGASIVGQQAGELILPWVVAIQERLKLSCIASAVVPYPTRSEISKRAAGAFFSPKLFAARTRRLVRFLLKMPF